MKTETFENKSVRSGLECIRHTGVTSTSGSHLSDEHPRQVIPQQRNHEQWGRLGPLTIINSGKGRGTGWQNAMLKDLLPAQAQLT